MMNLEVKLKQLLRKHLKHYKYYIHGNKINKIHKDIMKLIYENTTNGDRT